MGRHETVNRRSEHYSTKVKGSITVRGNLFAEFILLLYNSGRTGRMISLRKTLNMLHFLVKVVEMAQMIAKNLNQGIW